MALGALPASGAKSTMTLLWTFAKPAYDLDRACPRFAWDALEKHQPFRLRRRRRARQYIRPDGAVRRTYNLNTQTNNSLMRANSYSSNSSKLKPLPIIHPTRANYRATLNRRTCPRHGSGSVCSPVAMRITSAALPIVSAGRFSFSGPSGIYLLSPLQLCAHQRLPPKLLAPRSR